jgi:CRISPR system Cascade subunit CasC
MKFIQLHFLSSYPGALLNRDDAGFAKRLPFGGATRTRISSQCLKRHWRTFSGEHSLQELSQQKLESFRSRRTFELYLYNPLLNQGIEPALAHALTKVFIDELLGKSDKKKTEEQTEKKAKAKKGEATPAVPVLNLEELHTSQITVFGRPEVEYLLKEALKICEKKPALDKVSDAFKEHFGKDGIKNLKALYIAAGLDASLFGRMVTSDIVARGDAAIHVAHAITVHEEATESDYFSAMDELLQQTEEGALGSGHINSTELTSGLYYGYVVVDVPLLLSNLSGDAPLMNKVLERLVHLVATVSPGAKLGSTAPYAYAHLVLAEAGNSQPRTLANAFLRPVSERPEILSNTYQALGDFLQDFHSMYGKTNAYQLSGMGDTKSLQAALGLEKKATLAEVAAWVAAQARG